MSQSNPVLVFDVSKKEAGVPNQNMKKIIKKYRGTYKCNLNKDELVFDKL